MGRPCKELQLRPSCLRALAELSAEAQSLGAWEVVLRIRGLIMVARQYTYREVAACLGVSAGELLAAMPLGCIRVHARPSLE